MTVSPAMVGRAQRDQVFEGIVLGVSIGNNVVNMSFATGVLAARVSASGAIALSCLPSRATPIRPTALVEPAPPAKVAFPGDIAALAERMPDATDCLAFNHPFLSAVRANDFYPRRPWFSTAELTDHDELAWDGGDLNSQLRSQTTPVTKRVPVTADVAAALEPGLTARWALHKRKAAHSFFAAGRGRDLLVDDDLVGNILNGLHATAAHRARMAERMTTLRRGPDCAGLHRSDYAAGGALYEGSVREVMEDTND